MTLGAEDSQVGHVLPNKNVIRMHVLGLEGVGKTAFMKSVVYGQCDLFLKSIVGVGFLSQNLLVEDKEILLQLWESEPTSYTSLIVMYDITCRQSFQQAVEHLKDIRSKNCTVPVLLIGNKLDLEDERCVMSYEGELIALEYQALFHETSCQLPTTVKESITDFIKTMFVSMTTL